ncbi:hypothetical protein [Stenotrophomonas maltophilia]|uniref:Uncharacterized protein n=1 Tax=Stenotrophomonas maltophilia TaxID=40324 RepID=A0A4S2D327_STEMA|nr:hypothetical protein [Stenotrophomonas maltophilia]TGY34943.1 hypothetical protein E5352_08075 [Stenotrophomonas maltophilia]
MITPDSVRPKRPSTRPLVACVDTIKPRGFGFAQALGSSESIFLNEGRVRELGGPDAGLPGMLVTLTVAADAQGRLAAAKAAPLRLDDADAASLLWAACGGVAADLACGTLPAVPPLLVMAMAPAGIARPAALRALAAPGADLPARLEAFWAARPNWRPALLALFGELQGGRAWPVGWAVRDVEQATENAAAWARLCAALEARPRDWPAGFDAWPHWDHADAASIQRVGLLRISNSRVAGQQFAAAVVEQRRRTVMDAARLFEALTPDDHALAGLWCRRSDGNDPFPAEVAQMLTARAAEKAAAAYLNGLGLAVADVAIEQLAGSTDAWRVMDLNVDGMHGVDVKNIRRSKYGRLQSSRWKVKRFKRDASGAPVLLCGVSSPHTKLQYGALSSQDFGDSVRILGVTSAGEFAGLRRAFSHAGGITVRTGERLLELPAWAWDYPIAHYRQRDAALLQLREVVAGLPSTRLAERWRRGLPAVLLALWGGGAAASRPHAGAAAPSAAVGDGLGGAPAGAAVGVVGPVRAADMGPGAGGGPSLRPGRAAAVVRQSAAAFPPRPEPGRRHVARPGARHRRPGGDAAHAAARAWPPGCRPAAAAAAGLVQPDGAVQWRAGGHVPRRPAPDAAGPLRRAASRSHDRLRPPPPGVRRAGIVRLWPVDLPEVWDLHRYALCRVRGPAAA